MESDTHSSLKKTVTLTPNECIVIDNKKRQEILMQFRNKEDLADVYKQMLIDAWSVQEVKSQRSMSIQTFGPSHYEVVIQPQVKEELPIVGYIPMFAKRFKIDEKEGAQHESPDEKEPAQPADLPKEVWATKSSQMMMQLLEELNAKATYDTPFDKFIPYEALLPELDPTAEATLLARSEMDPVRGDFEERKMEEDRLETLLNLPRFEDVSEKNDEIKKKMKENIKFWRTISPNTQPTPPSQEDLKLLDFAALCSLYTGNWGMDEDTTLIKLFYKFQYDDAWRERIKTGCFNMLAECNGRCGICLPVTDQDMANMKDEYFFEIEDKDDYKDIVLKIREEFSKRHDDDTNWDFKQLIMHPVDTDTDSDSFVSDRELQVCRQKKPSSKEWIRAKGTWVAPKRFDVPPHDEEDLRPEDIECEAVKVLKYKDIVPHRDLSTLEQETIALMNAKLEKRRADERKGIYWRPKTNYLYRCPNFKRRERKKT